MNASIRSLLVPVRAMRRAATLRRGRRQAVARLALFALLVPAAISARIAWFDDTGDDAQAASASGSGATVVIDLGDDDNNTIGVFRRITAIEGDTMVYRVRRLSGTGPLSLDVRTADGTARAGEDYEPVNITFQWGAGEHSERMVGTSLVENQNLPDEGGKLKHFGWMFDWDDPAARTDPPAATIAADSGAAALPFVTRAVIQDNDFERDEESAVATGGRNPVVVPGPGCMRLLAWEQPKPQRTDIAAKIIDCEGFTYLTAVITEDQPNGRYTNPSGSWYSLPEKEDEVLVVFVVTFQVEIAGEPAGAIAVELVTEDPYVARREPQLARHRFASTTEDAAASCACAVTGKRSSATNRRGRTVIVGSELSPAQIGGATRGGSRLVATVRDRGQHRATFELTPAGSHAQVASFAGDRFVAVWEQDPVAAASLGVAEAAASLVARAFNFTGAVKGEPLALTTDPTASAPSIAASDDGDLAVTWQRQGEDGKSQIAARLQRQGGEPVTLQLPPSAEGRSAPQVAMNSAGDIVVTYLVGDGERAEAAIYDSNGEGKAIVTVASSDQDTRLDSVDVAIDARDRIAFAYERIDAESRASVGTFRRGLRGSIGTGVCVEGDTTLCLSDGRFAVTASWSDGRGESGSANAGAITGDTGYFWFFDDDNLEIVLKVLDACTINQRFWMFAGGLTDVEVDLTVTDTQTGLTGDAGNPPSTPFAPIQDTALFDTCDAASAETSAPDAMNAEIERAWSEVASSFARGAAVGSSPATAACPAGALCLHDERIQVRASFETADGEQGEAVPVALTNETGFFWFFDASNVETVIKVLDACEINDRFWVFAAGLTDVGVELAVTDTVTGETQVYGNPIGAPFQPIQDVDALMSCQ